METIGDRIKNKRKEAGMTQLELANKLNVTDRAVSKWEQGDGNPDITVLPKIAAIFGITLDYLIMGVEPEKEIVIMSKVEFCAKNDDSTMISSLPSYRDENGKSLIDYARQYNSKKVLTALVDNNMHRSNLINFFDVERSPAKTVINIMLTCIPIDREREVINEIFRADMRKSDGDFINSIGKDDAYSKEIFDGFKNVFKLLIANYETLSTEQKTYYFGMKEDEGANSQINCWFNAYPYFVDESISQGKSDLSEMLISQIEKHNKWVDSSLLKLRNNSASYSDYAYLAKEFKSRKSFLLRDTLTYLLSKDDFKMAYRVNDLLEKPHRKREIELLEAENNNEMSPLEKTVFRCVDNHIIVPDEILKLRDIELIKTILDSNYVNYYEMVYKSLTKDRKALFKFFVDNGYESLAELLVDERNEELLNESWETFNYNASEELLERQPFAVENAYKFKAARERYEYFRRMGMLDSSKIRETQNNVLISYFDSAKIAIFNEVSESIKKEKEEEQNRIERAKAVKNLTKDYFEKLLSDGNIESFIIKLCSLFEAILRFDYRCDSDDLSDKMRTFFEMGPKSRVCDDECGFTTDEEYEKEHVKPWEDNRDLMNKLRIQRNSIVHPESDENAQLNNDELKRCLEFVFSVSGGGAFNE